MYNVAIVGGGPFCTYALDRLASRLRQLRSACPVHLTVFDKDGRFGSGQIHSDDQPTTSLMNRAAGQIAFCGIDASNTHPILSFGSWCRARFAENRDPVFSVGERDTPARRIHGLALREMFAAIIQNLAETNFVSLDLRAEEVTRVERTNGSRLRVMTSAGSSIDTDHVLFVTGHADHVAVDTPPRSPNGCETEDYVSIVYPLEKQLTEALIPAGSRVGVRGLGLTALDVALYLSEGRGGSFVCDPEHGALHLRYIRSGREPNRVIAFGRTGLTTTCRPQNFKLSNPDALQHHGKFLTPQAIEKLRASVGVPTQQSSGITRNQLDFDEDVLPLMVLEMAYLFYVTRFGVTVRDDLAKVGARDWQRFLAGSEPRGEEAVDLLVRPLITLGKVLEDSGGRGIRPKSRVDSGGVFDWRRIFHPIPQEAEHSPEAWAEATESFLELDLARAAEGNLVNPVKAACDGVWRDLREVIALAVDDGGLTPSSHRRFISTHLSYYNRLSNGTGVEAGAKMLALVRSGLLDVSVGPDPRVERSENGSGFRVRGGLTKASRDFDVLLDAYLRRFDAASSSRPLYRNLLSAGLVRSFRNSNCRTGDSFVPGGLDLDEDFHPRRDQGGSDSRMTFLGTPSDGVRFFTSSIARPGGTCSVLKMIDRWAKALVGSFADTCQTHASATKDRSTESPLKSQRNSDVPEVTSFRGRIQSIIRRELASDHARDVVVLAVDGIPFSLAEEVWNHGKTTPMSTVFPATSSTAWRSAITGQSVDEHGVPGVYFRLPEVPDQLVDVFSYAGVLTPRPIETIFTDARSLGYESIVLLGDLQAFACTWRSELIRGASVAPGETFLAQDASIDSTNTPRRIGERLHRCIAQVLSSSTHNMPRLVWTFIDIDQYIHRFGYDEQVYSFARMIDEIALRLAEDDHLVIAHSDHGLVPTRNNLEIAQAIGDVALDFDCRIGGAGRVRWLHPWSSRICVAAMSRRLREHLGNAVEVVTADRHFRPGSLARDRVGDIVLIARGEEFIGHDAYKYDHGSMTTEERLVPFSVWDTRVAPPVPYDNGDGAEPRGRHARR